MPQPDTKHRIDLLVQKSLLAITDFNNEVIRSKVVQEPRIEDGLGIILLPLLTQFGATIEAITDIEDFYIQIEFNENSICGHFKDERLHPLPSISNFEIDKEGVRDHQPWRFWDVYAKDPKRKIGKRACNIANDSITHSGLTITIFTFAEHGELDFWDLMLMHIPTQALVFGNLLALIDRRTRDYSHAVFNEMKNKIENWIIHPWSSIQKDATSAHQFLVQIKEHSTSLSTEEWFGLAIRVYEKTLLELLNLGRTIRVVVPTNPKGISGNFKEDKSSEALKDVYLTLEPFEKQADNLRLQIKKDKFSWLKSSFDCLFNFDGLKGTYFKKANTFLNPSKDQQSKEPDPIKLDLPKNELFTLWLFIEKLYRLELEKASRADFEISNVTPGDLDQTEQIWCYVVATSLEALGNYLTKSMPLLKGLSEDTKNDKFTNGLYLWFCYQNLQLSAYHLSTKDAQKRNGLSDFKESLYRSHLAYVMREALRSEIFNERNDFSLNEGNFITSLKALVEHYIHLPKDSNGPIGLCETYDVGRFLGELGQVWGITSANSPLQYYNHVLHVLLSGLFLLDIKVEQKEKERTTVGDCIIAPDTEASPDALRQFKQAYVLAVLFHDVSHVICPFEEGAGTSLIGEKRLLKLNLANIEETLIKAGSVIANTCAQDLLNGHYIDNDQEHSVTEWIKEQIEKGDPDHGLISAWWLHHLCEGNRIKPNDMLKNAVRAILLHNAVCEPLSIDQDPVAVFLVLTNELFEWDLGSPFQIAPNDHAEQHLVSPDSLSKSRYRHLHIEGLVTDQSNPLDLSNNDESKAPKDRNFALYEKVIPHFKVLKKCESKLSLKEKNDWPHFSVQLKDPEYLDVPVMAIWLNKVQTFARFVPHKSNSWQPKLTIKSSKPPIRMRQTLSTIEVLNRLTMSSRLPVRPHLQKWLKWCLEKEHIPSQSSAEDDEIITVSNLDFENKAANGHGHTEPFFYEDIRRWMPRLLQEAEEILRYGSYR
jgi:hypothetical protein